MPTIPTNSCPLEIAKTQFDVLSNRIALKYKRGSFSMTKQELEKRWKLGR